MVLSELAREALVGASARSAVTEPDPEDDGPFRPFPARGPLVSTALVDRLREQEGV